TGLQLIFAMRKPVSLSSGWTFWTSLAMQASLASILLQLLLARMATTLTCTLPLAGGFPSQALPPGTPRKGPPWATTHHLERPRGANTPQPELPAAAFRSCFRHCFSCLAGPGEWGGGNWVHASLAELPRQGGPSFRAAFTGATTMGQPPLGACR